MSGDWLDAAVWESSAYYYANSNFTETSSPPPPPLLPDNTTLTCAARSLRGPPLLPYSSTLTTTVRTFQAFFYILTFLLGLLLNSLVIMLVASNKTLRTRSTMIALQVMALNLVVLLSVYVLQPVTAIANRWVFGEAVCVLTAFVGLTYLLLRTVVMFVFVLDRFFTVFLPNVYPRHSGKIAGLLSALTWVFAIAARTVGLPGVLDCYNFRLSANSCIHSSGCSPQCAIVTAISIGVLFGPTTILSVVLYAVLYCKARRIKKQLASGLVRQDQSCCSVDQQQQPRVSQQQQQREWRVTITFFLLFLAVFVLTTPTIVLSIVASAVVRRSGPSPVLYVLSAVSSTARLFLVVVDPVLIMRDGDMFRKLRKARDRAKAKTKTGSSRVVENSLETETLKS